MWLDRECASVLVPLLFFIISNVVCIWCENFIKYIFIVSVPFKIDYILKSSFLSVEVLMNFYVSGVIIVIEWYFIVLCSLIDENHKTYMN